MLTILVSCIIVFFVSELPKDTSIIVPDSTYKYFWIFNEITFKFSSSVIFMYNVQHIQSRHQQCSRDYQKIISNRQVKIVNETVQSYFKICRYSSGQTEVNHEKAQLRCQIIRRNFLPGTSRIQICSISTAVGGRIAYMRL